MAEKLLSIMLLLVVVLFNLLTHLNATETEKSKGFNIRNDNTSSIEGKNNRVKEVLERAKGLLAVTDTVRDIFQAPPPKTKPNKNKTLDEHRNLLKDAWKNLTTVGKDKSGRGTGNRVNKERARKVLQDQFVARVEPELKPVVGKFTDELIDPIMEAHKNLSSDSTDERRKYRFQADEPAGDEPSITSSKFTFFKPFPPDGTLVYRVCNNIEPSQDIEKVLRSRGLQPFTPYAFKEHDGEGLLPDELIQQLVLRYEIYVPYGDGLTITSAVSHATGCPLEAEPYKKFGLDAQEAITSAKLEFNSAFLRLSSHYRVRQFATTVKIRLDDLNFRDRNVVMERIFQDSAIASFFGLPPTPAFPVRSAFYGLGELVQNLLRATRFLRNVVMTERELDQDVLNRYVLRLLLYYAAEKGDSLFVGLEEPKSINQTTGYYPSMILLKAFLTRADELIDEGLCWGDDPKPKSGKENENKIRALAKLPLMEELDEALFSVAFDEGLRSATAMWEKKVELYSPRNSDNNVPLFFLTRPKGVKVTEVWATKRVTGLEDSVYEFDKRVEGYFSAGSTSTQFKDNAQRLLQLTRDAISRFLPLNSPKRSLTYFSKMVDKITLRFAAALSHDNFFERLFIDEQVPVISTPCESNGVINIESDDVQPYKFIAPVLGTYGQSYLPDESMALVEADFNSLISVQWSKFSLFKPFTDALVSSLPKGISKQDIQSPVSIPADPIIWALSEPLAYFREKLIQTAVKLFRYTNRWRVELVVMRLVAYYSLEHFNCKKVKRGLIDGPAFNQLKQFDKFLEWEEKAQRRKRQVLNDNSGAIRPYTSRDPCQQLDIFLLLQSAYKINEAFLELDELASGMAYDAGANASDNNAVKNLALAMKVRQNELLRIHDEMVMGVGGLKGFLSSKNAADSRTQSSCVLLAAASSADKVQVEGYHDLVSELRWWARLSNMQALCERDILTFVNQPLGHMTTMYGPAWPFSGQTTLLEEMSRDENFKYQLKYKAELFRAQLVNPFSIGRTIRVIGNLRPCDRFHINLYSTTDSCCTDTDFIHLHIDIRLYDEIIVMNARNEGKWYEDKQKIIKLGDSFSEKTKVVIYIRALEGRYQIKAIFYTSSSSGKSYFGQYPYLHEFTSSDVTHLVGEQNIDSKVGCEVEAVQFYGENYGDDEYWTGPGPLPTPFIPNRSVLLVQGFVDPKTRRADHELSVNLITKYDDIALHWKVLFDDKKYIFNHKIDQQDWGHQLSKEFGSKDPNPKNSEPFELYIFYHRDRFELQWCAVRCNKMAWAEFRRRLDPEEIYGVYVYGDVWVTNVQVMPSEDAHKIIEMLNTVK